MVHLVRVVVVCALVAASVGAPAGPDAAAGGSWLYPVQDRYEPGDTATLVGYAGGGPLGVVEDGPFYGYLFRSPSVHMSIHPRAIPLYVGELEVSRTGDPGYTAIRAALTFELPRNLSPGTYWLEYCNEGCEKQLGELIGGVFHIGVDPDYRPSRGWPSYEPEIANLADDALISGPGTEITAGELRSLLSAEN